MRAAAAPALVLDTNVALALWLFRDVRLRTLADALARGEAQWFVTQPMLEELQHEFTEARCVRYGVTRDESLRQALGIGRTLDPPMAALAPRNLRCTDPDDQKFIDLALQLRGCTLLSRDRAVLKLARRARAHGLSILTPEHWSP